MSNTTLHTDESRTQGLNRLELIRFLQVAQTITATPADARPARSAPRTAWRLQSRSDLTCWPAREILADDCQPKRR